MGDVQKGKLDRDTAEIEVVLVWKAKRVRPTESNPEAFGFMLTRRNQRRDATKQTRMLKYISNTEIMHVTLDFPKHLVADFVLLQLISSRGRLYSTYSKIVFDTFSQIFRT